MGPGTPEIPDDEVDVTVDVRPCVARRVTRSLQVVPVLVRVRCPRMGAGGLHDHGETTAYPGADDPQAPRGEKLLNEGKNTDEVCKHLEVSAPTWHRWVAQYG